MKPAREQILLGLAAAFRRAILATPHDLRPVALQRFPHESCSDASMLAAFLLRQEGFESVLVSAQRGAGNDWSTHAWLLVEGRYIVDLKAGQFGDAPAELIVATDSEWHRGFTVMDTKSSELAKWDGPSIDELRSVLPHVLARAREYLRS